MNTNQVAVKLILHKSETHVISIYNCHAYVNGEGEGGAREVIVGERQT